MSVLPENNKTQEDELLGQLLDVFNSDAGYEAELEVLRQMTLTPAALLSLYGNMGKAWILEQGLDTSEADKVFGAGWMERDHLELAKVIY